VLEKVSQTLMAFHPTPELARAIWVTGRVQVSHDDLCLGHSSVMRRVRSIAATLHGLIVAYGRH
jgi:hypothetical protein